MALSRFFTLKTSETLAREEQEARERKAVLETPAGLRSFIDEQQKAVDAVRASTEAFLADIENHFGDAAKYLTPAYTGRTKFENIESGGKRRIGVKWVDRAYTYEDCVATTVGFVYTETGNDNVRVDYILNRVSGSKQVVNDNYNPEKDDIYKDQYDVVDSFRTVRRYESHKAFAESGDHPPKWFLDALSTRQPSR